ncbi:glycerophosphoryl diester phosphodiesterase membrane domain-containing protein [Microbacterium tumbae]
MSGQMWTPAPRRGVVPLHPLTFGTMLGRAFSILRHNPKVVFGFAVLVQLGLVLVISAIMVTVLLVTFSRLERVEFGSPDYEPLLVGTIAINAVVGFALGLLSICFTAILQGVVAAEVRYAALGRKATLRQLWAQMRPAFWRLFGFAMLQVLFVFGLIAVAFGIIAALVAGAVGGSGDFIGLGIGIVVIVMLGAIPLSVWLGTKLLLTPSILVFERAALRGALVRSWRLTRGRFWVAFGIMFLTSIIMGLAAQVVSIPASLLSSILIPVIAPTGSSDPTAYILAIALGVLVPQILVLVLQAIAIIVQCTAAAFIYLDCRFRYEGLDQALLAHLERRDLGLVVDDSEDPFAVDPAHAVSSAPPPRQMPEYAAQPGWASAPGYPPAYPGQTGYGTQPGYGTPAGYGAPPPYGAQPGYAVPPQARGSAPGTAAPPQQAYPQTGYVQAPPPTAVAPAPAPPAAPAAPPAPPAPMTAQPPTDSPWAPPTA